MDLVERVPIEIAEALERGATVVTGNQRAARSLRRAFDRRNRDAGMESWRPAAVIAWDAWTAELWRGLLVEGRASELLLNRTQEHGIWRGILERDAELASLRSFDALAEMAAEAWRRLGSYGGLGRLRGAAASADTKAFRRWALAFERRCAESGLLSRALLEERLREAVEAGQIRLDAGGLVMVGFDRMTPAQVGMVEAVREAGVAVEEVPLRVPAEGRSLAVAADESEEIAAAAGWVREILEERPGARVAVIVPGLEDQRAEIDRVFREVLAPELESIEAKDAGGPYEFSLGVMLAETPMVAVALDLLRWAVEALPLEGVSALLLSTYFGSEERGARAEFDAFELRKARMLRPEVSLDSLIALVEGAKRKARLGGLLRTLRSVRFVVANRIEGGDKRTYAEWAERIRELLGAAGWGAGVEDSVEFQTRRKWEGALDELATLDFDGGKVGFERALEGVERIARETMFAPESREAPVQVMGPLEAAGATFDAVWFLRGGDLTWPVAAAGSPLLPWQMQRELGMPGVDVGRDREHARRMTERIAESAGRVVFSFAKEIAEGRQRPSPVLDGLGLELVSPEDLFSAEVKRAAVEVETVEDGAGIHALPDRVVRGGAQILQLQAACGFRAFAERRLWATEIEDAELGMDARESGTVVHRALELFWNEVQDQISLKAMSQAQQQALLRVSIDAALAKTAELRATAWDEAYVEMQRDRLMRLLGPWLDMERTRPAFAVKLSEKNFEDVSIGPLRLSVRVDRVDMTEAGELLIDYKTGVASPNDWLTERPDAPQLPLYAVLAEEQVKGVAFGLVRAGKELGLKGYATQADGVLAKVARGKMPFEMQVEEWRRVLEGLAIAFHAGDARVAPKSYPKTCRYCSQRELCRLDVSLLEEEEDEEADLGGEVSGG